MKKVWFFVPFWAIFCLFFIGGCAKTKSKTVGLSVSFFITDQEGLPVSGAEISFKAFGLTFITDDGGRTENVSLSVNADDCADGWYGTTVVVRAKNKVTIAIFNYFILVAEAWGIIVRKVKHRYSLLLPVPRFLYYEIVPTHVPADKNPPR